MRQVLSQEEIDSLLQAITSGGVIANDDQKEEQNKVKQYDFRRPVKLSREYIDTLYMIFENFSKLASMSLSNQIVSNVEITIKAIEQLSFDEFLRSISSSTVLGVFKSEPLSSNQIIAISPQLAVQIIEKMCGGTSDNVLEDKKDSFTEIELSIVDEILIGVLKAFEVAWKEIIPITTSIDIIGSNPQVVQMLSPNEPIVLTTFIVEIDNHTNFINICIPYLSFDNIMDKLSLKNRFKQNSNSVDEFRTLIEKHIMGAPVDIEVSLGKSIITIEDVLQLDVGDVIQLDVNINQPLGMYVENLKYYEVKPGQVEGMMAVEVIKYLEEEEGA